MKCDHCGFEATADFRYCPQCGQVRTVVSERPQNTAAPRVLSALKDKLFLVLCILMSASCGLTLITSGPDVLTILYTIFLWLTYAKVTKGIASVKYLRCISGTYYANYILVNVAAGIFMGAGVLFFFAMSVLSGDASAAAEITRALNNIDPQLSSVFAEMPIGILGLVVLIIFVLTGALTLVLNLFSNRYIHRFAKSVYMSINIGTLQLKHAKATLVWLYIFGVFQGIGVFRNIFSGNILVILQSGVVCAMTFVAAVLVKKLLGHAPTANS